MTITVYDLLIFDFDGTLVPTEELSDRLLTRMLSRHFGIVLTNEEHGSMFRGMEIEEYFQEIKKRWDVTVTDEILDELRREWFDGLNEVAPSDGVFEMLERLIGVPRCIVSNSQTSSIELALKATGLDQYFLRFFCADDVSAAKPAPDMYLLAASELEVAPDQCLVIEDSPIGVTAALAAGMNVVGYAGNSSLGAPALRASGVQVIDHFSELPELVLR